MGKVKIKKSDIWIDMTPMSDVMTPVAYLLHAHLYFRKE